MQRAYLEAEPISAFTVIGVPSHITPETSICVSVQLSMVRVTPPCITLMYSAAIASSAAFGKNANMQAFDAKTLDFSLGLMKKGKIDPLTYSW